MPKVRYEDHNFKPATVETIRKANAIIAEYTAEGYTLTLRQVYYQMVARGFIPNTQQSYSRLGDVISKARRAGMVDWLAIVDRTRNLRALSAWSSPAEIIEASAAQFRFDWWARQPTYVEVWFEKDALLGVFERAANRLRVPFFSCRGYTSDSEVWAAAQRLAAQGRRKAGGVVVLHFGDHDPSGIDMTRDIQDRLRLFGARGVEVRRLALNMDQIEQYDPPPNPAKESDSRFEGYRDLYGSESWELDALEPRVLAALVNDEVDTLIDRAAWRRSQEDETLARRQLTAVSNEWTNVVESPVVTDEVERLEGEATASDDDTDATTEE